MENQQQKSELDHYKQMLIERDMIIEQQDQRLLIDHDTQGTQTVRCPLLSLSDIDRDLSVLGRRYIVRSSAGRTPCRHHQ